LVIIPDGVLSLVPWEALVAVRPGGPATGAQPVPEAERRYLLDVGPPISYVPSATILVQLAVAEPTPPPPGRAPVLGIAKSDYRDHPGLRTLPGATNESARLTQQLNKSGMAVEVLLDDQATESRVRGALSARQIVHLACHGWVEDSHENRFGRLVLTRESEPAQLSRDGYLTLDEIYGLDLGGCELALLSAAETNLGPVQPREGCWSMARGFLVAGARRVVGAMWQLDDASAARVVDAFGAEIARAHAAGRGPDYAKSLRDAKRDVRGHKKWGSPFYWASFVLVGTP
jgi:CHAT domain-containing protein